MHHNNISLNDEIISQKWSGKNATEVLMTVIKNIPRYFPGTSEENH
jgi:hypothetical protein